MWLTDAVRAIPLALTFALGASEQTASAHLRSVDDVYRLANRPAISWEWVHGDLAKVRLGELVVSTTDDSGAKLTRPPFLDIRETGGELVVYVYTDSLREG